jgi:hypothetical protein
VAQHIGARLGIGLLEALAHWDHAGADLAARRRQPIGQRLGAIVAGCRETL